MALYWCSVVKRSCNLLLGRSVLRQSQGLFVLQGKGKAQAGSDSTPVRGPAEHQASHKMTRSATKSPGEAGSTPARRGKAVADSDTPDSSGSSGGGGKQGRRARRKEKMASADARARLLSSP